MKKFVALLCMLTCILSMTACSSDIPNEYQADKQAVAEQHAVENIIPLMQQSIANPQIMDIYEKNGYTAEEWNSVVYSTFGVSVDGKAYTSGLESFSNGLETMGAIISVGEVTSTVDDETIVVDVEVIGELKNGQVEMIFSNDYFTVLQSCTLNVDATFGELMTNAALNTVLGMGTVFAVLILIMFIIQALGVVSKTPAQKDPEKKESVKKPVPAPVAAPVVEQADDLALVAVIAAAIAAYEGKTSTDGFVVRSIKRAKRR